MSTKHYDIIIIGSGAGGGTLAQKLAPTGKNILILERGDFLPREEDNWSSSAVFGDAKYKAKETWVDKNDKVFHPGIHYYVGGNTKVYGAALLRFRKEDFGEIKHHGGVSPAWPIQYEDLASYYTEAEKIYHVHGLRGSDPTEPPESAPYPYPPLEQEPRIQELWEDLARIGHHPFPLPIGVRLGDDKPYPQAPVHLSKFDGFPDPTEAKADAHVCGIKPALKYPNVTLRTNVLVERLETNPAGTEITLIQTHTLQGPEAFQGDIVVVSCGAINSAALLLKSANDKHPNGLGNSSDVVGRNYMCHNNSAMVAISKKENPSKFQKTLGLNDFYFGSEDWEYPLGHIQMLGKSDAEMFKEDAPTFAPEMALEVMARHSLDFWMTSEDLPDPNNRVTLCSKGNIRLAYTENNLEGHKRLMGKLKGMLNDIGCHNKLIPCSVYLGKKIPIAGTAHQSGTIRFGRDSKTSALDINCKAHEIDNLYVVDGSFFVSSTAVNPALTIMANALRVGDRLLERLK